MADTKNRTVFDITGHFVRELKIILESAGLREGVDFEDLPFDPSLRRNGEHAFQFYNPQRGALAEQAWQKHAKSRLSHN
jgi:hypothetical protein